MIRHSKLPQDILDRIPDAANYLESRSDVVFAYLFWGLSKGDPKPLSDVDIAVYIVDDEPFFLVKKEIIENLTDIVGTDELDLVILNQSSLPLRINILKNNRLLVDKNPHFRHKYESLTMRKYFDYHRLESDILKRRFYYGQWKTHS